MKPIKTPDSDTVYTLPGGNEDNYLYVRHDHAEGTITSTWTATPEERELLAGGARIGLVIWGSLVPPVALALERPFCPQCKTEMHWDEQLRRYQCTEHGDGG